MTKGGACMAGGYACWGVMHGEGHVWQERRLLQRTVRIPLECILVSNEVLGETGENRTEIHSFGECGKSLKHELVSIKDPVSDLCLIGCLAMFDL